MTSTIQNTNDLLGFLAQQADQRKDWFGFLQQRIATITLAHEIAKTHADTMKPSEVVAYAMELNQLLYDKIIRKV
jgi:hypothetical protein